MSPGVAALYAALGDPSRCRIVERLSRGEATVKELRAPLAMTPPAVSKHLRVLEDAGLIERRRLGRLQVCRLRGDRLVEARLWLQQQTDFWESTLDSLGKFLGEESA
jgi:DNA-binding transcriptional ArsR family regulator